MRSTLGRRLALRFAAIAVGTSLLFAVVINLAFSSRFDTYLGQQRTAQAEQLAGAVARAYQPGGSWDTVQLDRLGPALAMSGADVRLLAPTGRQVWSATADMPGMAGMGEMHDASLGATGAKAAPVSVPVAVDGTQRGTLVVRLPEGAVPAADQQFRASVNRWLVLGGLGVAVLASVAGLLFARRVTRPVAELTDAARDLRAGHRGRRAAVTGRDEVAQLATAFNALAESAQRQEELRQSFTRDVAHEVRTPLAILRSQLEAVQDGVLEPTPELLVSLYEETLRLGRLMADLETLTSAEAEGFALERHPLDLADVAASVVASLRPRLVGAGITVQATLQPAPVCGDDTRLAQVLSNLLTNAAKFVPAGGRVQVRTERTGDQVRLIVQDDGPGIPADELPRVFDRYFRGSRARAGGSGIGLAVVAALVTAHGGTVEAANDPAGGAVLTVTLPAVTPPASGAEGGESRRPAEAGGAVRSAPGNYPRGYRG